MANFVKDMRREAPQVNSPERQLGVSAHRQQSRIERSVTANPPSGSASVSESGSVFRKLDSDSDPDTDPDGFRFSIAVGTAVTGQRALNDEAQRAGTIDELPHLRCSSYSLSLSRPDGLAVTHR